MKKFESIYDSEKFGKKELRKIKGGLKATTTNDNTNTPRVIGDGHGNAWGVGNGNGIGSGVGGGTLMNNFDSDDDTD